MLDITLSVVQAVFTLLLAYMGVYVTIKPPNISATKPWKYHAAFVAFGLISVSIVAFQGVRDARSKSISAAQISGLKNAVDAESRGRRSAEQALEELVKTTGKETRVGIADDLQKVPLKVQVDQKAGDTPQKKKIRRDLADFVQRGMAIRDKLSTDAPLDEINTEGQAWFLEVQAYLKSNLEPSYSAQFILTHPEPSPTAIPADKLPLWHGLDERLQTLNRFIDEFR